MKNLRAPLADAAVLVMMLCALIMTGFFIHDRRSSSTPSHERRIPQWERYAEAGNKRGSSNPRVTLVEFGDYECPFCRRLEPLLQSVVDAYPEDVAVVYRHFPLPYHDYAYSAARIAECGARQGWFAPVHRLLYQLEDLSSMDIGHIADVSRVPDKEAFVACSESDEAVVEIERDMAFASELSINSTPTLLINDFLTASTPDSARLFSLVEDALQGRSIGRR